MYKVNYKDTRTTPLLLFHVFCSTYFTPSSNVSIANFEHVIAGWVLSTDHKYAALINHEKKLCCAMILYNLASSLQNNTHKKNKL